MLWDVLLDEMEIDKGNKTLLAKIKTVFDANVQQFMRRANPRALLMDLNKQFLQQILLAVKQLFPHLDQEKQYRTIQIGEEMMEPYRAEDIQLARQSSIENEFQRRQQELEQYTKPQKPKDINLSYNVKDEKIVSMDTLLADKMAEREEIVTSINSAYNASSSSPYINPEPIVITENNKPLDLNEQKPRLKYLQLSQDNNGQHIDIKKQVHFEDQNLNKNKSQNQNQNAGNIFGKLKKVPLDPPEKEGKYEQQQSIKLQDTVPLHNPQTNASSTTSIPQPNNNSAPLLTNSQVIKQLNEMNDKINILTEKMEIVLSYLSKMTYSNNDNRKEEKEERDN